jgi:ribonuclease HII
MLIAASTRLGRAPAAGPVVAAAVILDPDQRIRGLRDSKLLTPEAREHLAGLIRVRAVAWAVAASDVGEIDALNILQASLLAMQRAVNGLSCAPEYVLVDARRIPNCNVPQRGIIRGDALSATIAAASIIAKTTRDAHMIELDGIYSGYGLAGHKGYPTRTSES